MGTQHSGQLGADPVQDGGEKSTGIFRMEMKMQPSRNENVMAGRPMHRVYLFIGIVFILLTVGLRAIFVILITSLAFITGLVACLIHEGYAHRENIRRKFMQWTQTYRFSQGIPFTKETFVSSDTYCEKQSMTNSELLEPVLEQILDNIMRDNVDSWYNVHLTSDKLFQSSLKRTARRTIIAFRTCISKVDWVPLLTRHFVDDFASHLRLYRQSKERLQLQRELISSMKDGDSPDNDLESLFFDLELEMEKSYCRDLVSTSPAYESAYLHDVSDILLYLLMPSEDFRCRPLRFLIRELFVTKVLLPLLDLLSEPCFINRTIVWLLSELPVNTEDFVNSLENCKHVQELEAILESIHDEVNSIRSKGGGVAGGQGGVFTSQLASLEFTKNLICRRMMFIANKTEQNQEEVKLQGQKEKKYQSSHYKNVDLAEDMGASDGDFTLHLPLTVILTHPIALSHFVEFLNEVAGQNYIDFYLAIEGFKNSMRHHNRGVASGKASMDSDVQETLREAALFMYHQYLSHEAITRVPLGDSIVNKFLARLRNDIPSDYWFEQIQDKVVEILRTDGRFFPSFKRHRIYKKMLEELGIESSSFEDEAGSLEEECIEDLDMLLGRTELDGAMEMKAANTGDNQRTSVLVEMLGVGHQGRQLFALYNVRVTRADSRGGSSSNVIRRYSDFHALHNLIVSKFSNLRTLSFPGKKTFNNLDQNFLDKRCQALNQYMNCILQPSLFEANAGLEQLVFDFLSQKRYTGRESFHKAMGTMFNPIMSGMKAFGSAAAAMPSDLIDGIGKMGSELNRAASSMLKGNVTKQHLRHGRSGSSASTGNLPDSTRVAAHIDENDENIPLRLLLLLVDEVFGFRAKTQWFRRRLVSLLRQFVNVTLGNSINKQIIDAVNWLTSEEQVAQYLIALRDCIWNDSAIEQGIQQDTLKTRFLARCLMLSAVPDELRLFIGTSTIHAGIDNVSEVLQNRHLNRRFWYVVFERLLVTIFPHNHFDRVLPQLHAKSPRTRMA